jgi:zinc transport system substrate-binding protein
MMRRPSTKLAFSLLLLTCAGLASCGGSEDSNPRPGRPAVFVSIEPLRYFAEAIGGDKVDVHVLVGPGQSPATYEPTARQMAELADADLFFVVGVPMEEQLLPRIRRSLPGVEIVDARAGVELAPSAGEGRRTGGGHDHPEFDPHIWLDPRRARTMAYTVYQALQKTAPAHRDDFYRNYRALDLELANLANDIAAILAPVRGKEIVVFHPAFSYFADAFELEQVAIEAGGVTPGSRHLAEIIELARDRGVKAVFVQPQFSSATATAVAAAIGAELVTLDPLATDYSANLRRMADDIHDALSKK